MFFSPLAGLSLGTYKSTPCRVGQSVRRVGPLVGTNESIDEVICFTDSLSGFSFRVSGRGRVRDGAGDGFRARVRDRASVRAK